MFSLRLLLSTAVMNLRSLPRRRVHAFVMVISIAAVVAVFSGVLAMNAGLDHAMLESGRADRAIILRAGSTAEIASAISREDLTIIKNAAAGASTDASGVPLIAAEAVAPLALIEKRTGLQVNATLRGVGSEILAVRPEIKIVAGRMFQAGKFEVIVGQQALQQFQALTLGEPFTAYQTQWKIVGVFTEGGSIRQSEMMTDAGVLMNVTQRPVFQNVTIDFPDGPSYESFKKIATSNPSVALDVYTEAEFLHRESQSLNGLLRFMAYVMGGIMALGAIFVAVNAMYSGIDDRRREIATLRAIGFPPGVVITAIVAESLLLAVAGGLLGALVAGVVANGHTVSTAVGVDLHELVFDAVITIPVVLRGLGAALVIGIIGGLVPAVRSIRSEIVTDLRAI
jgi:putative ABC transport system permease protein